MRVKIWERVWSRGNQKHFKCNADIASGPDWGIIKLWSISGLSMADARVQRVWQQKVEVLTEPKLLDIGEGRNKLSQSHWAMAHWTGNFTGWIFRAQDSARCILVYKYLLNERKKEESRALTSRFALHGASSVTYIFLGSFWLRFQLS